MNTEQIEKLQEEIKDVDQQLFELDEIIINPSSIYYSHYNTIKSS